MLPTSYGDGEAVALIGNLRRIWEPLKRQKALILKGESTHAELDPGQIFLVIGQRSVGDKLHEFSWTSPAGSVFLGTFLDAAVVAENVDL